MDNKIISIEEVEKEANEALEEFKLFVDNELIKVSHFKRANLDELLKIILEDCQDLSDLELSIEKLKKRISQNQELKERLLYQRDLTKKDIVYENIIKIYLIYNIMLSTVWITSSDMLVFIKNFLIALAIGTSTFWVNLDYFTSERRKKQIDNTVMAIDKVVEINQYDIFTFNTFRSIYIDKLTFEVRKLFEIVKSKDHGYEKIEKFLDDLHIEFLLNDKSITRRIKKK